jgi:asparagine synthase (glutamine-hydrolysing)
VALMQAQSARPVKTFSIGFHEAGYDEAVHAAPSPRISAPTTPSCTSRPTRPGGDPALPTLYDEPFADSSQIPTFLVSSWPGGTSRSRCPATPATSCSRLQPLHR